MKIIRDMHSHRSKPAHSRLFVGGVTLFFALLWIGCLPPPGTPKDSTGQPAIPLPDAQQVIEGASEVSTEFRELSKPNKVQVWVDGLVVKAQPGKDMPKLTTLNDGDVVEYMYQRTIRKSEFTLRGQRYYQPWIMVKLPNGTLGWVHEGGIRYLEPELPGGSKPGGAVADDGIAGTNDWLIVPGRRLGQIKVNTTETDLIRLFGEDEVTRGKVQTTASQQVDCTIVFPGKDDEIRIVWKSGEREKIKAIYITSEDGKWHLKQGVKVGISLDDLTKLNESPVSFYGFQWEYSGTISSYRTGVLAPFEKYFYMALVPAKGVQPTILNGYKGDKVFSSNADGVELLGLTVEKIVVYLD